MKSCVSGKAWAGTGARSPPEPLPRRPLPLLSRAPELEGGSRAPCSAGQGREGLEAALGACVRGVRRGDRLTVRRLVRGLRPLGRARRAALWRAGDWHQPPGCRAPEWARARAESRHTLGSALSKGKRESQSARVRLESQSNTDGFPGWGGRGHRSRVTAESWPPCPLPHHGDARPGTEARARGLHSHRETHFGPRAAGRRAPGQQRWLAVAPLLWFGR